ncbi:unnamed protein product [Gongylonema pulchrum]|uniref:7TM_GPCR_Srx domain-containing protein n=1 Tax=Gongylonema pulchrum TaxID=637853 RepID=A0A183D363_9BILA|nr:unnamed protein product [Gongylonema pulchrum]
MVPCRSERRNVIDCSYHYHHHHHRHHRRRLSTKILFKMAEQLLDFNGTAINTVGGIYIFIGIIGFICNLATLLMIASYRMYRLSAYTIMANLALADAFMLIVAGLICGLNILQLPLFDRSTTASTVHIANYSANSTPLLFSLDMKFNELSRHTFGNEAALVKQQPSDLIGTDRNSRLKFQFDAFSENLHFSIFLLSFFEIAAWTAGMMSYAFLGINRCVAICFYRTRAKTINRVSFALIGSTITWIIGVITACIGTMPVPLMGMRTDMWTVSFLSTAGRRPGMLRFDIMRLLQQCNAKNAY